MLKVKHIRRQALTVKEYALLELFVHHPNRAFSLDAIIDNLWAFEAPPSGDAVRTHIKGIRQKLKAGGASKNFIERYMVWDTA